jgi:hypothetical protein
MSLPVFGTISKITGSFGTTFEVTGSYLKAETSFLKRFTGRILRISKWFQRKGAETFFKLSQLNWEPNIVKTFSGHYKMY